MFIEPEGLDTKEMYVQGVSSTLPEEVQVKMYKTIIGLEKSNLWDLPMELNMIV